jgi:hypothetical protein
MQSPDQFRPVTSPSELRADKKLFDIQAALPLNRKGPGHAVIVRVYEFETTQD